MAGAHSRLPEDSFREWAPLSDLFNKLPTKIQIGLFPQDVNMTCVDVLPDFIVIGTNLGIVYWYDRKKKDLQRLRCEVSGFVNDIQNYKHFVNYFRIPTHL